MTKAKKRMIAVLAAAMMLTATFGVGTVSAATVTGTTTGQTYTSSTADENAVLVSSGTVTLTNATVTKTGNGSGGDNGDFYGTNAAVLAKGGATLNLKNSTVTSNGSYANGVFSYGSGTTVNVSDTTINTKSNNSGGIMTTGGATMNATDLTVNTEGNSSAAIRSDRGGGTVTVTGGKYNANGVGSPGIYSTADITATGAAITATKSEAVVIEGGNSVTLKDTAATGNNSTLNGQSQVKTNVMIYQSMSGDASSGKAAFAMDGGSLTAKAGCMFYVTNTTTTIDLNGVALTPSSSSAKLLQLEAGPWGTSGSNGGHATVNASGQTLTGDISVDSISSLNLKLTNGSAWTGALTSSGSTYVSVPDGCTWKLTGDSTISSLSCASGAIDLNGHTLTVNGTKYTSGASTGTEIEQTGGSGGDQSGQPGQPGGTTPGDQSGQPPALPEGTTPGQNGEPDGTTPPTPPTDESGNPIAPPDGTTPGQTDDPGAGTQQNVVFKNTVKTFTAKALKKTKKTYSVIKTSGGGDVNYKVTKGKAKYISVSKAGKVTVKKGAKKGAYKVKLSVAAAGGYSAATQTITIRVR